MPSLLLFGIIPDSLKDISESLLLGVCSHREIMEVGLDLLRVVLFRVPLHCSFSVFYLLNLSLPIIKFEHVPYENDTLILVVNAGTLDLEQEQFLIGLGNVFL